MLQKQLCWLFVPLFARPLILCCSVALYKVLYLYVCIKFSMYMYVTSLSALLLWLYVCLYVSSTRSYTSFYYTCNSISFVTSTCICICLIFVFLCMFFFCLFRQIGIPACSVCSAAQRGPIFSSRIFDSLIYHAMSNTTTPQCLYVYLSL